MPVLLVWRQNGIDFPAIFRADDDCAVANGKPGAEQFGHFVGERRGEGDRAAGDGIADVNGRCSWARKRRRLDVFTDQLSFLARKRERRLLGLILCQGLVLFGGGLDLRLLGPLRLIKSRQPFPQGKQFALERGDFGFQGFDLGECEHRAGADRDDE